MSAKGLTIALSGKGGVGKTFISSMLVKRLSQHGSVLAIDADPDSNLPQALGVSVKSSVGQSREDIINAPMRSPVTNAKQEHLEQAIHQSIEEFPAVQHDRHGPFRRGRLLLRRQPRDPGRNRYPGQGL